MDNIVMNYKMVIISRYRLENMEDLTNMAFVSISWIDTLLQLPSLPIKPQIT